MAYIFGSIWDRFNRNALNDLSKSVEVQGKTIQDLVAEGQLTPAQYAQLIQTVNGLVTKGDITDLDLSSNLRAKVNRIDDKANIGYVNEKISNVASGSPSGTFSTLTALQNEYPNGDDGIYVVTSDGNWYWYNGTSWVSGGKYQSSGIAENSIKESDTTFTKTESESLNLFNPETIEVGKTIHASDGYIMDAQSHLGINTIKVKPGMTYVTNGDNVRLIEYDESGQEVGFLGIRTRFKMGDTTRSIIMSTHPAIAHEVMFVEGHLIPPTHIPFKKSNTIEGLTLSKPVSENQTTFLEKTSVNLFNKDDVILGYRLIHNNTLVENEINGYVPYLKVKPNTTYTVTEGNYVVQYNEYKEIVTGHEPGITQFTTTSNTHYLGMTVRKVIIDEFMIVEGENLPSEYQPFNLYKLKENIITNSAEGDNHLSGAKLGFIGDSIVQNGDHLLSGLKRALNLSTVTNYGVGGTSYAERNNPLWDDKNLVKRIDGLSSDLDIICVLAGTNDFSNYINLGDFNSRDEKTFYGALHLTFESLVNKFPHSKLYVFTMPSRYNQLGTNLNGGTVFEYADAIIEVANHYSIPVYDTLRNSQLRFYNDANKLEFSRNDDGLHPNEKGYDLMLPSMINFIKYM